MDLYAASGAVSPMKTDVLILGGGLAGLRCALECESGGLSVVLIEASEQTGGRVSTHTRDGFLLDRGFQVLLHSYPEVNSLNLIPELNMGWFPSGALLAGEETYRIANPFFGLQESLRLLAKLPPGSLQLLPFARLGLRALATGDSFFSEAGGPAVQQTLSRSGLKDFWIERFFRPFFGGVLLDPDLETDARYFFWLLSRFATGRAGLPEKGMGALPAALQGRLRHTQILAGTTGSTESGHLFRTHEGQEIGFSVLVDATGTSPGSFRGPVREACTLYFAGPAMENLPESLILNGDRDVPVQHLCFPSVICPSYAPPGYSLCSISVPATKTLRPEALQSIAKWIDLRFPEWKWKDWHFLEQIRVERALPVYRGGRKAAFEQEGNRYRIGDTFTYPSINGALQSGREAGKDILKRQKGKT